MNYTFYDKGEFVVEKAINHYSVTNRITADIVHIVNQGEVNYTADSLYAV